MTTFTVLNTNSTGAGSLRDAVDQANAAPDADVIVFAAGVSGTIDLAGTGSSLFITEAVTIAGPGAARLKIVADAGSDIFDVGSGSLIDVAISGLTLTGVNGGAAAVTAVDTNLRLTNMAITGNNGAIAGGLYFAGAATPGALTIDASTISGNAGAFAGGVAVGGASALIVNATIANNTGGGFGGGLSFDTATVILRDSTVVGNIDPFIEDVGASNTNLTIENSIIYTAGGADDLYFELVDTTANSSLIGSYSNCGCSTLLGANNLIGVDPRLAALADNGGPVQTMLPASNSPVIDAGNSTLGPPPATDARGQSRVWGRIDLGAVEVQYLVPGSNPPAPPPAPPPSNAPRINADFGNLTRFQTYGFNPPLPATVTTPDGKVLPNPFLVEQAIVKALIVKVDAGGMTLGAARDLLVDMADATTSVATLGYQFFTGKMPTKAGLDYLVSSPENATDLNDGFYAGMSLENRYINFAVNLGTVGEGRTAFAGSYGALSLTDAAAKAYAEIFGAPPADKIAEILTPDRVAYFTSLGGDAPGSQGLGAKAAMVGWLLAESAKSDIGPYAVMNENFLYDLADGVAAYGADLHIYLNAGPRYIGLIGEV